MRFIVFIPLALLILFSLRRTGYGRLLFAIGDNPVAARLSGARAWQVLIALYVISALLAALAGFLISGLTNVASVTLADTYVLPSVAAAVIGGASLAGGVGTVWGAVVGAMIIGSMNTGLDLLNVSPFWQQVVKGVIIVVAIIIDERKNRRG